MSDDGREVKREAVLDASPGEVWEALTDKRLLSEWLADEVELDPVPGARVRFRFEDGERHGTVERVEEERSLSFSWARRGEPETMVEFSLEPAVGGTRLVVVERASVSWPTALAGVAWDARLSALALALALVAV